MTATALPTAAPAHAIRVWCDHLNVYAEVPSVNQPCVLAFPLSEAGLTRALALLGAKHNDEAAGQPYLRPVVIAKDLQKNGLTQDDIDKARASLRELGIIK